EVERARAGGGADGEAGDVAPGAVEDVVRRARQEEDLLALELGALEEADDLARLRRVEREVLDDAERVVLGLVGERAAASELLRLAVDADGVRVREIGRAHV